MASRDSQTVLLSRQAILLVTAVGVGLLTLCYVLGVQVGKQSAALHQPLSKGAGEELEELPATMAEQLKALEHSGGGAGFEKPQKAEEPKAEAPPPPRKPAAEGNWTLQLVSTPDAAEAKTVLAKAKAAGFHAETLSEKGLFKVRLSPPMKREAADAATQKLRNHGFKPFAIKVD